MPSRSVDRLLDLLGRKVTARTRDGRIAGRLVRIGVIDGRPVEISLRRPRRHRPRLVHLPADHLDAADVELDAPTGTASAFDPPADATDPEPPDRP